MSIKHFVGDHISASLVITDEKEFIRIAKERNPDEFMDLDIEEWNELFTVVEMIQAANRMKSAMGPQITLIPMDPTDEEG